jgi:hypothetical protein
MHRQIELSRRATWESQVKIAALLKPTALEHRIDMANLELVPLTGVPVQATTTTTTRTVRTTTRRR